VKGWAALCVVAGSTLFAESLTTALTTSYWPLTVLSVCACFGWIAWTFTVTPVIWKAKN
jgi:hypothetical protein